jgi:signal transduction histidine kinase
VVQRRSDDPELVELARTQDAELRAFLRGGNSSKLAEKESSVTELLGPALALVESRFGVPVQLVVVDPGTACGESALALAGAAAEAATNASKHSGADEVWVSVDRAEHCGTLVVVHDEGCGFNRDTTNEGDGLRSSVRGRLDTVGGTVAVRSSPGTGCDVTLWAP